MRKVSLAAVGALLLSIGFVHAAQVKVTYTDPSKFSDLDPSNEARGAFQKRTLASFDEIFASLAAKLPEGYQWNVNVTDIDLAGDVKFMMTKNGEDIRVIKEIFSPRVNFNYEILDANQAVVLSGEEKVKDMSFMTRTHLAKGKPLQYERDMLERWFRDNLEPSFADKTKTSGN